MERAAHYLLAWTGRLAAALLLALPGAATASNAGALHLTSAEVLVQQTSGFSPPPYSQASSALAGTWARVVLPHVMPSQLADGDAAGATHTVITWYRADLRGLDASTRPHYLYVPRWKSDGQIAVYGDGRLLYQSHANLLWNGSNHPLWIALGETAGAQAPKEILIRIQRLRATGGALSTLWAGDGREFGWRYRVREWLQAQLPFMCSAAFLAVGIFALAIWFRRRNEPVYMLFFLVSGFSYLRAMHDYVGLDRLPVSDEWFGWMTVNSVFWIIASTHFFMVHLHRRPKPWLERSVVGVTIACSLITLPVWPAAPSATVFAPFIYGLLLLVGITTFTSDLISARAARSRNALLLGVWSYLSLLIGLHDWLLQNNVLDVEGSFLGSYTTVGAFVIFMYIMFRRYLGAIAGMEELNASLEARLAAREAELSASHERLRAAEHHQTLARERQRLMQDMHDGLGSSLRSALWAVERGKIAEPVEMAEVLKSCIDDLKLAIDSMEPVESDLLLLLATLRYRLGSRLESTGLTLGWEIADVPPLAWLEPRASLHILRILQEVFTNIIKHTHATHIRLATEVEGDSVVVSIRDNGTGFDLQQALRSGGHGLNNQMRRAEAVGGSITWESGPAGTLVRLRLPLVQAPPPAQALYVPAPAQAATDTDPHTPANTPVRMAGLR